MVAGFLFIVQATNIFNVFYPESVALLTIGIYHVNMRKIKKYDIQKR